MSLARVYVDVPTLTLTGQGRKALPPFTSLDSPGIGQVGVGTFLQTKMYI